LCSEGKSESPMTQPVGLMSRYRVTEEFDTLVSE
jgi:hypothetical protein